MQIYVRDLEGDLHMVDAEPGWSVGRLRCEASRVVKVRGVDLMLNGEVLGKDEGVWEVGIQPGGVVELTMSETEINKIRYINEVRQWRRRGAVSGDIIYSAVVEDNLPLLLAVHEVDPDAFHPEKLFFNPILLALPNPHLFSPLHECGIPLTTPDPLRGQPLLVAVQTANLPAISELASLGVNLDEVDELQRTALCTAVTSSSPSCCRMLLQLGANPNKGTVYGTPLTLSPNIEIFDILLDHGADPCLKDDFGRSTLHRYLDSGGRDRDIINKLVSKGVDVDGVTKTGQTALLFAVSKSDEELVEVLVSCGARVDLRTRLGSPLSTAVRRSCLGSVRLLTLAGANLQAVTPYGATLLELATSQPMANYLHSQGVNPRPLSATLIPLLLIASLASSPSFSGYLRCAATLLAPSCVSFLFRVAAAWKGC